MTAKPNVLVIVTGGTIFQSAVDGRMATTVDMEEIAHKMGVPCRLHVAELEKRPSAELSFADLKLILDNIDKYGDCDGIVIVAGTDGLEDLAFAIDMLYIGKKAITLCGAIRPVNFPGYDGIANFADAVKVALSPEAEGLGPLIVMNSCVHPAIHARETDNAVMDAFTSHPGPIAQMRRGKPYFYYTAIPDRDRPTGRFDAEAAYKAVVPICTLGLSAKLPNGMFDECDGLVLASMGAGSMRTSMIEQLSPKYTDRFPIVISTRCPNGQSYDDYYYQGSKAKYESRGFKMSGYENLNPIQARLKLILELTNKV